MVEQTNAALEAMVDLVEQKAKELADLKRATNVMCRQLKQPEIFTEEEEGIGLGTLRVRPDQFYGKSPIVAAREYLEIRHEAAKPEEILDALQRGGFDFPTQNWPERDRLRLLALSLSKNSVIFHRLPNGTYGLLKWYPNKERERDEGEGAAAKKRPQAKGAAQRRPKQISGRKGTTSAPAARPRRRKDEPGVEEAVQKAISRMSSQFTLDKLLERVDERQRDRARVRAELNRIAAVGGSGVRVAKKGALHDPAIYERTDASGGQGQEDAGADKRPDLKIAR